MKRIYKFGTRHCGACMLVGRMLDRCGIPYEDIDCEDGQPSTEELMRRYNVTLHVPVVVCIDDRGCMKRLISPDEVKEWIAKGC